MIYFFGCLIIVVVVVFTHYIISKAVQTSPVPAKSYNSAVLSSVCIVVLYIIVGILELADCVTEAVAGVDLDHTTS